ncbi:MAG: transposase [Pirellulales bacterium]|nr:transposase [Pirellulales bacterium]
MHYRDRVHRPRGFDDPGHAHEFTFSCYHRFPFLAKNRTCIWLAESLHAARIECDFQLWAYVFMPDHVHLIVCPRTPKYDGSRFLRRVKEPVARKAIAYLKQYAPHWLPRIRAQRGARIEHHFWQPGRGYDRNVIQSQTLLAMIDYLHLNPVRKRLVDAAKDWPWSSAGWFAGEPRNDLQPDSIPHEWLGMDSDQ